MIKDWTEEQWSKHFELIRRGKLFHLLHDKQREVVDYILAHDDIKDHAVYSCRKLGKSFLLCVYGIWYCLNNPGCVVRHVMPTTKNARDVVIPIMGELNPFFTEELRPRFYASTGTWHFQNGSKYILTGAHRDALDSARGSKTECFLMDECAFFDAGSFDFATQSVFFPQQSLVKNPKIIWATTPPVSIMHPFVQNIMPKIMATGAFHKFTVYSNPLMSAERIQQIKDELGENSNAFRREYLAEIVSDDSLRVTPEFDPIKHVTDELPPEEDVFGKRTSYTGYEVADYGVGKMDFSGILTCVFDHNAQQLVVTGERLQYRPVVESFVQTWNEARTTHLSSCYEVKGIVDAFESLRHTLRVQYGLDFLNPRKGKIEDTVAFLRNCLENNKIKIHSSCKNLIAQLTDGIWDEKHLQFERSTELGHLDLLICLVYVIRSVDWKLRPGSKRNNIQLGLQSKESKYNAAKKAILNLR